MNPVMICTQSIQNRLTAVGYESDAVLLVVLWISGDKNSNYIKV